MLQVIAQSFIGGLTLIYLGIVGFSLYSLFAGKQIKDINDPIGKFLWWHGAAWLALLFSTVVFSAGYVAGKIFFSIIL